MYNDIMCVCDLKSSVFHIS